MYKAFHDYVPRMATPGDDRRARARHGPDRRRRDVQGRGRPDQPRDAARDDHRARVEEREDFAKQIWAGMDEDKFLGPCKVCEEAGRKRENGEPNRLRIIDLKGGKRMYGCEGWNRDDPESPDSCPVSGPLPGRFFELWRLEERCSVCGERPRLTVKKRGPGRAWKLCLNDDCPTMVEMREKRAEREAANEARKAAKEAAEDERRDAARRSPTPPAEGRRTPAAEEARADHRAHQAGPLEDLARPGSCSSPSRASTAPARPPRRRCWRTRSGRARCCCASRAAPRRASGSASCSRTPRSSSTRAPSCCCSTPPGRSSSASVIAPAREPAPTSSATASSTRPSPTRASRAGSGPSTVERLNELVVGACVPDLTLLLRIDPERRRRAPRATARTASSAEGIEFQRRVAAAYDELAERHPERIVVVDGAGEVGEVAARPARAGRGAPVSAAIAEATADQPAARGALAAAAARAVSRLPARRAARARARRRRRGRWPPSCSPTGPPTRPTPAGGRSPTPRRTPTSSGCARRGPSTWSRTCASG